MTAGCGPWVNRSPRCGRSRRDRTPRPVHSGVSHALGLELRGYRGDELMRWKCSGQTQALLERARDWRAALERKGWTEEGGA